MRWKAFSSSRIFSLSGSPIMRTVVCGTLRWFPVFFLLRGGLAWLVLLSQGARGAQSVFEFGKVPDSPKPIYEKDRFEGLASWQKDVDAWLNEFNGQFLKLRQFEADAAWNESVRLSVDNQQNLESVQSYKEIWRSKWCEKARDVEAISAVFPLSESSERQLWFMCRGPSFSPELSRSFEGIQQELYRLYHSTVLCWQGLHNETHCEHGEPDLAERMATERSPRVLLAIWEGWHNSVGTPGGKRLYRDMVRIMNEAARRNGYRNTAETWMEALAIPNVNEEIESLLSEIMPLYKLLHAYVRFKLGEYYGPEYIGEKEPLPAHLLGNMWAQSWSALSDVIAPESEPNHESLSDAIRASNMSVADMVKMSEKFYTSMGFEPMKEKFWSHSQFVKPVGQKEPTSCHPSALDMYTGDDYRMQLCGEKNEDTFLTIHHEMGHVQYYMNYAQQPAIFRDGANPAFHEAVGDSINYAVQSKAHLKRLGITVDDTNSIRHLLLQSLHRIPLIAWSVVVDKWRWDVFEGKVAYEDYNRYWWKLRRDIQGVQPNENRDDEGRFDPMAKFHIPDNTPYMPYFFSSFLQVQLFEGMCHASNQAMKDCDLYGSKAAGEGLRRMLRLGQSRPWKEALYELTGETKITAKPLLEYYRPLYEWLSRQIYMYNIPVGW